MPDTPELSFSLLLPWEFSPTVLLTVVVAATLYARGAGRTEPPASAGRRAAFFVGLLLVYCALQTRWDYYASHMFFVHRLQHLVLHDIAPALLAGAAPGGALAQGLPAALRRHLGRIAAALRVPARVALDPWTATAMYVASLLVWLWPPLHFDVMLSNWLYKTMNFSVVLGDLPFWWLILNPSPYPRARVKSGYRILMLAIVMLPMMAAGAYLSLSDRDHYLVYEICGRFLPISAVTDQQLGGLIIWIAGGFFLSIVFLIAFARMLAAEERAARAAGSGAGSGTVAAQVSSNDFSPASTPGPT